MTTQTHGQPAPLRRLLTVLCLLSTLATAQTTKFLKPRTIPDSAQALQRARATHAAMIPATANSTSLSTPWQPAGPNQIATSRYGNVTGRVSSLALDPSDTSGNTLYIGTTGGGVWKSTNAASISPTFAPLTDTLAIFSANSGTAILPSLSIGAITVQPGGTGVLLAGTGDPNDASDSYYGEGILRSADNGLTWTLAQQSNDGAAGNHSFVGEGIAAFAWNTSSPQLVVAAVSQAAEGTLVGASKRGNSVRGLFYSTDAGVTWQMATISDGATVVQSPSTNFAAFEGNAATAVVYNPIRQRFYAAVRFHGYYESADGSNWTRLTNQPGSGLTTANCPARANTVGSSSCPLFRGALAVQPVSGDLFALTTDLNNAAQGLYQDTCSLSGSTCSSSTIAFAHALNATPMETSTGIILQADYNLTLAAVPSASDTLLFAGTSEIFRCSLSAGCALRNTTNATTGCAASARVAPAQHAIAVGLAALIYFGNDGGLWRSTDDVNQQSTSCSADDATHFQNLNASLGSLAEVASLATHPAQSDTMLAGLGALGSASTTAASALTPWQQLGTGESAAVAIDQGDPRNWFLQSGGGVAILGCHTGSTCTAADFTGTPQIGLTQVQGDISLLDAPFLLDPDLNTNAIVGTCRVYRGPAAGGSLWSSSNAISAPLSGPANSTCNGTNALIRSLGAGGTAVSSSNPQNSGSPIIYAGMAGSLDGGGIAGGHFYTTGSAQTAAGGTVWTDRTANTVANDTVNAGRFNPGDYDLSSIYVDPHDPSGKTVYVTVMGFGYPHLYRSTDAGATWLNLSRNLPDAPANAVAVDPNDASTVYIALDTGVYVTTQIATCATANCWSVYGTNLPNAPITQLNVQAAVDVPNSTQAGALRAATYGRGIWQIPLVTAGTPTLPAIQLNPTSLTFTTQPVGTTSTAQKIVVTNSGNAPLIVTSVQASTDFAAATTDCVSTHPVAQNASCTVAITFVPATGGARSGTVSIYANVTGGYASATLTGTATSAASIVLVPATLAFTNTLVGSQSAVQTITATNNGTSTSTLQTPALSGDFTLISTTCGTTLAPTAFCTNSIAFAPTATGTRTGSLYVTDNAGLHSAQLTGTGIAPAIALSALTLNFADTALTQTTAPQTVTVTNSGSAPLSISSIAITGDFAKTDTCTAHSPLAAQASCTVAATFSPTATGARTGVLSIATPAATATVTLTGNGRAAFALVLTPTSLTFASTSIGNTTAVQNITISNTGTATGNLGTAAIAGDFLLVANTCGATLPSQTGCTVSIAFKPTVSGIRTGIFTIASDSGPQTASLVGTGTTPATDTLASASLAYPDTLVNTTSAAQTLTLTNSGDVALTLIAARITSGDFTVTNACGNSLSAHSTCSFQVFFVPKSVGPQSGLLTLTDALGSQTVALTGTGLAPPGVSLSPISLTYGITGVGNASAPQTLTLTNNGGSPLQLNSVTLSGDFGVVAGSNTCPITVALAINSACTLQVAFVPHSSGARSGNLTVVSNAPNSPQTIQLAGTGVDFTWASSGPTSAAIANGKSAAFPFLLTPATTMPQSAAATQVAFTCTGAPAYAKCTVTPSTADLTAITTVTATVLTGTAIAQPVRVSSASPLRWPWFAVLFLPALYSKRRRTLAVLYALVLLAGCGAGRQLPTSTAPGNGGTGATVLTPSGSYPITVSVTAAGLTKSQTVTLTVQ